MKQPISVVMTGATGAVGSAVVCELIAMDAVERLTLLGRSRLARVSSDKVVQHIIDVLDPESYRAVLTGHNVAISTLGIGQPSKITREQFVKIDRDAVLDFGTACRKANVGHFQLLSSVGVDNESSSFFLRSKGELEHGLQKLNFERLSLFHPSMILTPTNRYGLMQGITLALWPLLAPILAGPLRKFRGIEISRLSRAMARNVARGGHGVELLEYDDFVTLSANAGDL